MSFRLPSLAVACLALVGSLFAIAAPAEAAPSVVIRSSLVAMSSAGNGKVLASCRTKKTCRGTVWVSSSQKRSYAIKGRSSGWITFGYSGWRSKPRAVLYASGAKARRITMEARVPYGTIAGKITRAGGPVATDLKAELWSLGAHQQNRLVKVVDVPSSGAFSFRVRTGPNNSASAKYKVHIIGEVDGQRRSWWWRGSNGSFAGGAREMAYGSKIAVTRGARYRYSLPARYSAIQGYVRRGSKAVARTEVTVIGRPARWSKSSRIMRELDIMSCAYVYGRATTSSSGYYRVGFLPTSSARIYAVKSEASMWNNRWGTCHAAVNYRREATSTKRMLALGGTVTQNLNTLAGRTDVRVSARGYQGPSSTAKVDRYLTVREYAKGRPILSSDVVRATSGRTVTLGEGYYWFELGRRTGCSAWYNSRYENNDGYFNGLDRGFEKWKARNHRMYRQHCRAYTTGVYRLVNVRGGKMTTVLTNRKGGSVSGKVTSAKIKPRTELMVRLTSSDGRRVYRTAMTDGGGRFKVTGLASGSYKVVVNADSWRGISRTFKGRKTVTAKAGSNRSVGTLRFIQ